MVILRIIRNLDLKQLNLSLKMFSCMSYNQGFFQLHKSLNYPLNMLNINFLCLRKMRYLNLKSFELYKLLMYQIEYNLSMLNSYYMGKTFSILPHKLFRQLMLRYLYIRFFYWLLSLHIM